MRVTQRPWGGQSDSVPTNSCVDAVRWWARGACHRARIRATRWLCPPYSPIARLSRRQPPVEAFEIDEAAGVTAFADLAVIVEGLDLEADDAALDRDHARRRAHGRADRRGCQMTDIDLGADRDPAGRK